MYIKLSFHQQIENNSQAGHPLRRTSVRLANDPVIINELPPGEGSFIKIHPNQDSLDFHYYINCADASRADVEEAIKRFKTEFKETPDARYIKNVDPEKIPAIKLMKTIFKNCLKSADTNDSISVVGDQDAKPSKGVISYLPDSTTFSNIAEYVSSRKFLFFAAAVAGAALTVAVLDRKNSI